MTRRADSAISHLFSFAIGYLAAFAVLTLMGYMQMQDERDETELSRVIACSQVADMCEARK